MRAPLVSIAVPVLNCSRFLQTALNSLIQQTYKNLEIIICNNNSTDNTKNIIKTYLEKDNRIRHHLNSEVLCAKDNFNLGFKLSSGKYFMWAACDDIWHPSFIEKAVMLLENNKKIVAVDCLFSSISDSQLSPKFFPDYPSRHPNKIKVQIKKPPEWSNFYALYRTNVVKKTRLLINPVHDYIFRQEIALKGPRATIMQKLFFKRKVLNKKEVTKIFCYNGRFPIAQTAKEYIKAIDREKNIRRRVKKRYKEYVVKKHILSKSRKFKLMKETGLNKRQIPKFVNKYIMTNQKILIERRVRKND